VERYSNIRKIVAGFSKHQLQTFLLNQLINNSGNVDALHEFIDSVRESTESNLAEELMEEDKASLATIPSGEPAIKSELFGKTMKAAFHEFATTMPYTELTFKQTIGNTLSVLRGKAEAFWGRVRVLLVYINIFRLTLIMHLMH
jgi:hypothetical protein